MDVDIEIIAGSASVFTQKSIGVCFIYSFL
jgi:hypothetical protein